MSSFDEVQQEQVDCNGKLERAAYSLRKPNVESSTTAGLGSSSNLSSLQHVRTVGSTIYTRRQEGTKVYWIVSGYSLEDEDYVWREKTDRRRPQPQTEDRTGDSLRPNACFYVNHTLGKSWTLPDYFDPQSLLMFQKKSMAQERNKKKKKEESGWYAEGALSPEGSFPFWCASPPHRVAPSAEELGLSGGSPRMLDRNVFPSSPEGSFSVQPLQASRVVAFTSAFPLPHPIGGAEVGNPVPHIAPLHCNETVPADSLVGTAFRQDIDSFYHTPPTGMVYPSIPCGTTSPYTAGYTCSLRSTSPHRRISTPPIYGMKDMHESPGYPNPYNSNPSSPVYGSFGGNRKGGRIDFPPFIASNEDAAMHENETHGSSPTARWRIGVQTPIGRDVAIPPPPLIQTTTTDQMQHSIYEYPIASNVHPVHHERNAQEQTGNTPAASQGTEKNREDGSFGEESRVLRNDAIAHEIQPSRGYRERDTPVNRLGPRGMLSIPTVSSVTRHGSRIPLDETSSLCARSVCTESLSGGDVDHMLSESLSRPDQDSLRLPTTGFPRNASIHRHLRGHPHLGATPPPELVLPNETIWKALGSGLSDLQKRKHSLEMPESRVRLYVDQQQWQHGNPSNRGAVPMRSQRTRRGSSEVFVSVSGSHPECSRGTDPYIISPVTTTPTAIATSASDYTASDVRGHHHHRHLSHHAHTDSAAHALRSMLPDARRMSHITRVYTDYHPSGGIYLKPKQAPPVSEDFLFVAAEGCDVEAGRAAQPERPQTIYDLSQRHAFLEREALRLREEELRLTEEQLERAKQQAHKEREREAQNEAEKVAERRLLLEKIALEEELNHVRMEELYRIRMHIHRNHMLDREQHEALLQYERNASEVAQARSRHLIDEMERRHDEEVQKSFARLQMSSGGGSNVSGPFNLHASMYTQSLTDRDASPSRRSRGTQGQDQRYDTFKHLEAEREAEAIGERLQFLEEQRRARRAQLLELQETIGEIQRKSLSRSETSLDCF